MTNHMYMAMMSIIMNSETCLQRNRKGPKLFSAAGRIRFPCFLNRYPANVEKYGELLIMPANGSGI